MFEHTGVQSVLLPNNISTLRLIKLFYKYTSKAHNPNGFCNNPNGLSQAGFDTVLELVRSAEQLLRTSGLVC